MSNKQVFIAGGSGFIGQALAKQLANNGWQVTVIGRQASIGHQANIDRQAKTPSHSPSINSITWEQLSEQAQPHAIINLAGASIAGKRWSEAYQQTLLDSRLTTTQALVDFALSDGKAPEVFINASAIGVYGDGGDTTMIEDSAPFPALAQTQVQEPAQAQTETTKPSQSSSDAFFSQYLCEQWEAKLAPLQASPIRLAIARLGVVLDASGGAFVQMALPFKCKVAVKNGSGAQWFSWVSLTDAVNAFEWLLTQPQAAGVYNLTAPTPLTNSDFTQALKNHYGAVITTQLPACVIKTLFGKMGEELLLASQRILPQNLQNGDFNFQHNTVEEWLRSL